MCELAQVWVLGDAPRINIVWQPVRTDRMSISYLEPLTVVGYVFRYLFGLKLYNLRMSVVDLVVDIYEHCRL